MALYTSPRRAGLNLFLVLALAVAPAVADDTARPNILILVADDLGWNDVGFHGSDIATPSLDRLASEGVELTRFYTNPICTPTRAALMTGRDPIHMGYGHSVIPPWSNAGIPLDEHFMSETFRANGYQTGIIGKWHLGHTNRAQTPNARGFDYFYGNLTSGPDYYTHESRVGGLDWQRNGTSVEEEGYNTDLIAADAVRFITDRDTSRPFFLYVPWNAPHTPLQAPGSLKAKYLSLLNPMRIIYAAMTESLDSGIGTILDALDKESIAENTLVLFFSDNGGMPIVGGRNEPLRGGKGSTYEGAIRVPAVIRWSGVLPGNVSSQQIFNVYDVFPTLSAAAGINPAGRKELDGVNLLAAIREQKTTPHRPMLFAADTLTPNAIRYGVLDWPWKLVRSETNPAAGSGHENALFNLEVDPNEKRDLKEQQPEKLSELLSALTEWQENAPQHRSGFNHFPHPGWAPPTDWNEALLDITLINTEYSRDKRTSEDLQLKLREAAIKLLSD